MGCIELRQWCLFVVVFLALLVGCIQKERSATAGGVPFEVEIWVSERGLADELTYTDGAREYLERPWQHIDTRPRYIGLDNFGYSPLFPFYLVERIGAAGDPRNIIKSTWEQYQGMGNCGAVIPAIQNALPVGQKIEQIFPSFAETNYVLAYQEQADIRNQLAPFQGGVPNNVRPLREERNLNPQALTASGPGMTFPGQRVQYLASTYAEFQNGFDRNNPLGRSLTVNVDIYLDLNDPASTNETVKLLIINVWNPPNIGYQSVLPLIQRQGIENGQNHYRATGVVQNFDVNDRVILILTNPQIRVQDITYHYSAVVNP